MPGGVNSLRGTRLVCQLQAAAGAFALRTRALCGEHGPSVFCAFCRWCGLAAGAGGGESALQQASAAVEHVLYQHAQLKRGPGKQVYECWT